MFDKHKKAIAQAATHRQKGDAPAAIDRLAEVLERDDKHVAANAEMARALRLIGDPSEAESYYRAAIAEVLDYSLVVELAECLVEQGRVEEAEEVIDGALAMASGNARLDPGEALIARATIALAQERHLDAAAALDLIVPKRAGARTKRLAEIIRADLPE